MTVTWRAPGRVNLIGEHTDYNEGFVLPFAIDRSVTVTARGRDDRVLELRSDQEGPVDEDGPCVVVSLDGLEPGAVTGWAAYAAGAAWALREAGYPLAGASLTIRSDLPQGAGLASSAALECAVVASLADLAGVMPPRAVLVALARRAENDFVGVPCGIMDQSAVMLCEAGHALLLDCRSGETQSVPLDPASTDLCLLVIDTGVRHELTGGEYAARRRECETAASLLHVPALRDAASADGLADPVLARRARHVITDNERVVAMAHLLRAGRLADCGPLLTQSHRSLRDDFEVSWPEADRAVEAVLAAGALGARMIGGGFGGCVLALLPEAAAPSVRSAVRDALAAPAFLTVTPAPGAGRA